MPLDSSAAPRRYRQGMRARPEAEDGAARRALRVAASLPVRLAVSAALLAILAVAIDWSLVADRLRAGRWEYFAAAVGAMASALLVGAARWHELLAGAGIDTPRRRSLRAYMIGTFSNNFLPQLGGDAARAWLVAPPGGLARATTTALIDRLTALACLVAVAWAAIALGAPVPRTLVLALLVTTALGVAGAVSVAVAWRGGPALLRRLPALGRFRGPLGEVGAAAAGTVRDRRTVAAVVGLGVVYQLLAVLSTWLVARAVGVDVPYGVLAAAIPVVLVLTLIPISVGGFGLREGGFVVFLADAGVGASDATLVSVLSVAVLALASLPGAVALLTPAPRPATPHATTQARRSEPAE
jgi:glycosyltransferase 2 family protein